MNGTGDGSVGQPVAVYNFSEKILEQVVHFHVMRLDGGFFLWVGSSPELSNLAVSMCSKHVNTQPAGLCFLIPSFICYTGYISDTAVTIECFTEMRKTYNLNLCN